MHHKVMNINNRMRLKLLAMVVLTALLLLAILIACSGGMSDDEKAIAVAIGLTQTAAALGDTPATEANAVATVIPVPPTAAITTSVPVATNTRAVATTAVPPVAAAGQSTDTVTAPVQPTPLPVDALAVGSALPVTQHRLKVRTLLVAPGEPGRLYALLTDATYDTAAALGAQLLTSADFGESWEPAPSGLPVEENCLFNINMDYYGATALYASTCQGIYRWREDAPNWTAVAADQTGMVAIVYGNADLLWATKPFGTTEAPLRFSQNGGASWTEVKVSHTNGVAAVGISPRDSQTGYAIVWPGGDGSALRRGTIFTDWQVMPAPEAGLPVNPGMTIDGGTGWLYITTAETEGDRLWRSSDPDTPILEDVSWEEVHHFAAGDQVELLASGWSTVAKQLAIYANLQREVNGAPQFILIRSLDNGQSWAPLIIDAG